MLQEKEELDQGAQYQILADTLMFGGVRHISRLANHSVRLADFSKSVREHS